MFYSGIRGDSAGSKVTHQPPAAEIHILRPLQNGRHFANYIFECIFLNENVWISINVSLKLVPKGLINNISALV